MYSNGEKEIILYVVLAGILATILLAWIANKILKKDIMTQLGLTFTVIAVIAGCFPDLAIH